MASRLGLVSSPCSWLFGISFSRSWNSGLGSPNFPLVGVAGRLRDDFDFLNEFRGRADDGNVVHRRKGKVVALQANPHAGATAKLEFRRVSQRGTEKRLRGVVRVRQAKAHV